MKYLFLIFLFPCFAMAQYGDTLLEMERITYDASATATLSIIHTRDSTGRELITTYTSPIGSMLSIFDYDQLGRIIRKQDYLNDGTPSDSTIYRYQTDGFVKSEYFSLDTNFFVTITTHYSQTGSTLLKSTYTNEYGLERVDTTLFNKFEHDIASYSSILGKESKSDSINSSQLKKWSVDGLLLEEQSFLQGKLNRVARHSYDSGGLILSSEYFLGTDTNYRMWDYYTYWEEDGSLFRKFKSDTQNGQLIDRFTTDHKLLEQLHYLDNGTIRNRISYTYDERGYLIQCKKEYLSDNPIVTTTIYTYKQYAR